jgi:hypothetical protein
VSLVPLPPLPSHPQTHHVFFSSFPSRHTTSQPPLSSSLRPLAHTRQPAAKRWARQGMAATPLPPVRVCWPQGALSM